MRNSSINERIQLKITEQLYKHASAAIWATILNSIIVLLVFRNLVSPVISLGWAILNIGYLLFRFFFTKTILRKKITILNYRKRLLQFGLTIFIWGLFFGSSGVVFLSHDRPAYNAFIFFLMGGMFAGSLGAFALNRKIFYLFSAPIILPVTVHSFLMGGEINTAMAVLGLIFITMMVIVVGRMNATMVSAIRLGILNIALARKTSKLNDKLLIANENFRQLSMCDMLTKIKNRRFLFDVFQNELDRFVYMKQKKLGSTFSEVGSDKFVYGIFIIDIDHFKLVNDTWGHACGDKLLIEFVKILTSLVRKDDVLSRWGGEEFVLILKRTSLDYLDVFAKKLIDSVSNAEFRLNESVIIKKTCSLGFTSFPFVPEFPSALTLEQTIDIADRALYYAKSNGRNQAVNAVHTPQDNQKAISESVLSISHSIEESLIKKNITLLPLTNPKRDFV